MAYGQNGATGQRVRQAVVLASTTGLGNVLVPSTRENPVQEMTQILRNAMSSHVQVGCHGIGCHQQYLKSCFAVAFGTHTCVNAGGCLTQLVAVTLTLDKQLQCRWSKFVPASYCLAGQWMMNRTNTNACFFNCKFS